MAAGRVHKRKPRDVADPSCEEWVEFGATSEAFPVLHGVGHIDRMDVAEAPDGPPFEGLTLRLFDPAKQMWRIWWSSSRAPGRVDPPLRRRRHLAPELGHDVHPGMTSADGVMIPGSRSGEGRGPHAAALVRTFSPRRRRRR
jgi:hypothetical protein